MKKLCLLVLITLLSAAIAYSETIPVEAGTDQISAAYETAQPGDIIELVTDGGIYVETAVLRVQKDIVIRGAEDLTEKPVWQCAFSAYYDASDVFGKSDMESAAIEHFTNADLHLSNLIITGLYGDMEAPDDELDYTYQAIHFVTNPGDTLLHKFQLICDGVDFHFFHKEDGSTSGNVVRMAGFATEMASLLKFTNCTFYEAGRGIKIDPGDDVFKYPFENLIIENCTFAKIKKDYPILFQAYPDSGDTYSPPVIIKHCTIVGSKDDALKPKDCFNIIVENNIFFDVRDQLISNHGDGAAAYFNYNCYWDVAYKEENRPLFADNVQLLEQEGNVNVYPFAEEADYIKAVANFDADFYPRSEFDFTLDSEVAATLIGNDGKVMGDQRWCNTVTSVKSANIDLPVEYDLAQNYPNPFNPTTTIRYNIVEAGHVKLHVYNMLGQKVRTLVDTHQPAGKNTIQWDGMDDNNVKVTSGIYFYKLEAGTFASVRKMILVK